MEQLTTKDVKVVNITKVQVPVDYVSIKFRTINELKEALGFLDIKPPVLFRVYGKAGFFPKFLGKLPVGCELYFAYKPKSVFWYVQEKHINTQKKKKYPTREVLS